MWAWFLTTRVGRSLIAAGTLMAAIALACLYWFQRGARGQAAKDKAKDAESLAEAAQRALDAANARKEVDDANAKLPDAPPQAIADADPATAAGRLRTDGWVRGPDPDDHQD